jgi:hypothetical protein
LGAPTITGPATKSKDSSKNIAEPKAEGIERTLRGTGDSGSNNPINIKRARQSETAFRTTGVTPIGLDQEANVGAETSY